MLSSDITVSMIIKRYARMLSVSNSTSEMFSLLAACSMIKDDKLRQSTLNTLITSISSLGINTKPL